MPGTLTLNKWNEIFPLFPHPCFCLGLVSHCFMSLRLLTPSLPTFLPPRPRSVLGSFLSLLDPGPLTSPCLTVADQPWGRWGSGTFCLSIPASPLHTRGRSHSCSHPVSQPLYRGKQAQGGGLMCPGLPRSKCREDSNPSSGKLRDALPQCPGDTSSPGPAPSQHPPTPSFPHTEDSPLSLSGSPSPCQELATS